MWYRYWGLGGEPFREGGGPFVGTGGFGEALARVKGGISGGERLVVVRGEAGCGKTVLLARAMVEMRGAWRRFARVSGALDGAGLFGGLAAGLGVSVAGNASRAEAWKGLGEAVRLCRWQKIQVVLVVDDCEEMADDEERRDLERLVGVDPNPETRLTVVRAFRAGGSGAWGLEVRLLPMTRSETGRYVLEKLEGVGRGEELFTAGGISRLYEMSGGVPRLVDRVGALALMAGAARGDERVGAEVVEGVARECGLPWRVFAA